MRIFDNPNHPHYGPVRRMWIILAQLDLLHMADQTGEGEWDQILAKWVQSRTEAAASRLLLRMILNFARGF